MKCKKNIVAATNRAVSPKSQRDPSNNSAQSSVTVSKTPLTDFICSRLKGDNLQLFALMFALMFAEAIKNDRHAKVILFESVYHFLGYDRYDNAVRQLKKLFKESELVLDNHLTGEVITKTTPGRSKERILISVRQFETLMLKAHTGEGWAFLYRPSCHRHACCRRTESCC